MNVSRDEFGQLAKSFMQAQGELRPVQYDAQFFRLVIGTETGPTSFAYLGHAYDEMVEGERPERILSRRLWSSIRRDGDAPVSLSLSRVMPRLRDLAFFSQVRRQAELEYGGDERAIESVLMPHQKYNDALAIQLAYELPTSVSELENEHLSGWKLSFNDVLKHGLDNLAARSTQAFESPGPGLYVGPWHDGFDSSRLLLTDLFSKLELKGAPVAMVPTHSILVVTGDEDAEGLLQIATWAEEALQEPRNNTGFAFRLENGTWQPWLPPRGTPAFLKLRMMQLQTLASLYGRQQEVLEALLETNGHDIFVGGLRAFRTGGGYIFTSCAWTEGVDALLPVTDRIDFVRMPPEKSSAQAQVWSTSWQAAQRIVGDLMEETGDVPVRIRASRFPTDAQLEQLAAEGALPK